MCACRSSRSFLIDDLLKDVNCKQRTDTDKLGLKATNENDSKLLLVNLKKEKSLEVKEFKEIKYPNDLRVSHEGKVEQEIRNSNMYNLEDGSSLKLNLDRRNSFPLCPLPVKPGLAWSPYRVKEPVGFALEPRHPYSLLSEHNLGTSEHLFRSQFATNRFLANPFAMRHPYGFDRGKLTYSMI